MASPTVWIVGDSLEPVFAEAIDLLRSRATACSCFDCPQNALELPADAAVFAVPTAILFPISRPGRFVARDIERLHARVPLSRLVALTGPWCEGELRSGRPWTGVVRIAWRSWQSRLLTELGLCGPLAALFPRTRTETERIEDSATAVQLAPRLRGTAAIRTRSIANYRYLADAVGQLGLTTLPRSESMAEPCPVVDVVIFDGWHSVTPEENTQRVEQKSAQRRLLTLHFPRPDDYLRARAAGLDGVLGQPLVLTDLAAALSQTPPQPIYGTTRPTPN